MGWVDDGSMMMMRRDCLIRRWPHVVFFVAIVVVFGWYAEWTGGMCFRLRFVFDGLVIVRCGSMCARLLRLWWCVVTAGRSDVVT